MIPALVLAATLTWTMPVTTQAGKPLGGAPLAYQIAYSHQSQTFVAHRWAIISNPDSMAAYWPAVVAECEPVPVASGYGLPGARMSVPAPLVISLLWPFSLWVRTKQDSSAWSVWSNPVTRADNQ